VALFRAGHDEAFRVIHDRYRQRLFAYTRQMLVHRQDAEDALQDVFVRAYSGLRASDRELALRAWLYRVAHNRCIDQLRRPSPPPPEVLELLRSPVHDPIAEADQRESLRRLIADVRRLPDQQRSALLMRELAGMSYADLAGALGVTIPAVKSLLVRARLALAQALEARDTACSEIREELIVAHDRGLRPNATSRRHMRDCAGCCEFRQELRGVSRTFGAIVPTLGPLGVLANLLGVGGAGAGSGVAGGALAAGGAGGAAGSGTAIVSVGALSAGATHVATLLAAAVVTAGGAVELQHNLAGPAHPARHARVSHVARPHPRVAAAMAPATAGDQGAGVASPTASLSGSSSTPPAQTPAVSGATGQASATSPAARTTAPSSTTITTVTVTVKQPATGGISTALSPGGASPTDPGGGTTKTGSGATTTGSSTGTPASSATGTQGETTGGSTSSTQASSSTGSSPPTSSTSSAGSSQGTTTGTGASTGATASGTTSPSQ
jgi:RNA polymerase sigma factor (sigma-70 family)